VRLVWPDGVIEVGGHGALTLTEILASRRMPAFGRAPARFPTARTKA
jgi:hypothetical protein